jgi:hypothetical protein
VKDKLISDIVQRSFPYHREALARCAAEDYVDFMVADSAQGPNLLTGQVNHAGANRLRFGKVELVRCAVNRVDFNRCDNVKPCLLEP